MILDKKLQLASNFDIGNAARTKAGTRISDLFPMDGLGDVGAGEQLYCCVTVRESFSASTGLSSPNFQQASLFSFRIHHTYDFDPVAFEAGADDALTVMYAHRMQPLLGSTSFIPNNYGNFTAGKKFIFPISPISNRSRLITGQTQGLLSVCVGPTPVAGLAAWDPGTQLTYLYAVVEETGSDGPTILSEALPEGFNGLGFPVSSYPVNQTVSGRVDIDIVTIADFGAGPGFSDGKYYPTGTIVR